MDADIIVLCDDVFLPEGKKEIDGGVAIADGQIIQIGERKNLSEYLGIETQVMEYHNCTLFTFEEKSNGLGANIAVVAGNRKRKQGKIGEMVGLRFLMYQGDIVYQKEL